MKKSIISVLTVLGFLLIVSNSQAEGIDHGGDNLVTVLDLSDGREKTVQYCRDETALELPTIFLQKIMQEKPVEPESRLNIPVYWYHLVQRDNGDGAITAQQVSRQMEVLNRAFSQAGITFHLLGREEVAVSEKLYNLALYSRDEAELKRSLARDPKNILYIYTASPGQYRDGEKVNDFLGWAYLPIEYEDESHMHGVVLNYRTLPGGDWEPFNLGNTLVHEVGHYLGLYHTFHGSCSAEGDLINDTPAQYIPAKGCPVGQDSCPDKSGDDPVHNYMNYSNDSCMTRFTIGQIERMHQMVREYKPNLGRDFAFNLSP